MYITRSEAIRRYGYSRMKFHRLEKKRLLQPYTFAGSKIVSYKVTDLDALMQPAVVRAKPFYRPRAKLRVPVDLPAEPPTQRVQLPRAKMPPDPLQPPTKIERAPLRR